MKNPLLRHFFRTWIQHLNMQMATLVVLSGTFTVITIALLIHQNLDQVLTQWGDSIKMNVFVKDGVSPSELEPIKEFLHKQKGVSEVNFVSKQEAAASFQKHLEKFVPSLLLDANFENPLPASFEVSFDGDWGKHEFSSLVGLGEKLMSLVGVEDVSYGQGWVENYAVLVDKFHLTSWFLIFILLSGSLFVVGNSIRNSVAQRRDEIEILELVGGTIWSIRWPYIFEGMAMGFMAAFSAIIITYGLFIWQSHIVNSGLGLWASSVEFQFLSTGRTLIVMTLGGMFGAVGSLICVRKISNGWAAAGTE